jgi:alkaline phosphatase D
MDSYTQERKKLFNYLEDSNINYFVVLTGDVHSSWGVDSTS